MLKYYKSTFLKPETFIASLIEKISLFLFSILIIYLFCKFTLVLDFKYLQPALVIIFFIVCSYIDTRLEYFRRCNQLFIKRRVLKGFAIFKSIFSLPAVCVYGVLLGYAFGIGLNIITTLLLLALTANVVMLITILRKRKIYAVIILFSLVAIGASFFINFVEVLNANKILFLIISIFLCISIWIFSDILIYPDNTKELKITFQETLSFRNQVFRSIIFEFIFIFRVKKKQLLMSFVFSLIVCAFILTIYSLFLPEKASASDWGILSMTIGTLYVGYGSFVVIWSMYYLDELRLKKISLKAVLLGKMFFLTFYTIIIYFLTVPFMLLFNIMVIEYTIVFMVNAFVFPVLSIYLGSVTMKKEHFNTDPVKYGESDIINRLINTTYCYGIGWVLWFLNFIIQKKDILIITIFLSIISLLSYKSVIQTCERIILKKRRQYESTSN
ncbi:MAG: hypothetical protein IJU92_05570 [Spirochaetaceae bacterium]|nr:hypothetical protein [Spirochaetaceae bacterium]